MNTALLKCELLAVEVMYVRAASSILRLSAASHLASFPGVEEGEERAPGTHCLWMRLIATEFRGDRIRTCNVRILVTS